MNNEKIFLVKRAQRRDKEAFCELINVYMKDMYRTARAILANEEDAGMLCRIQYYRVGKR